MAKVMYSSGNGCHAAAVDEKSADGAHHSYEFTHTPSPGGPDIPLSKLKFQNGPANDVGVNGVTDVMVIAAVIDHLSGIQAGPYRCGQNDQAIAALRNATQWLVSRPTFRLAPQQGSTPEGNGNSDHIEIRCEPPG